MSRQVDFACPGLLNDYKKFQKYYQKPIEAGREKGASKADVAKGRERAEEVGPDAENVSLHDTDRYSSPSCLRSSFCDVQLLC